MIYITVYLYIYKSEIYIYTSCMFVCVSLLYIKKCSTNTLGTLDLDGHYLSILPGILVQWRQTSLEQDSSIPILAFQPILKQQSMPFPLLVDEECVLPS